jgi:hypothetical protein
MLVCRFYYHGKQYINLYLLSKKSTFQSIGNTRSINHHHNIPLGINIMVSILSYSMSKLCNHFHLYHNFDINGSNVRKSFKTQPCKSMSADSTYLGCILNIYSVRLYKFHTPTHTVYILHFTHHQNTHPCKGNLEVVIEKI